MSDPSSAVRFTIVPLTPPVVEEGRDQRLRPSIDVDFKECRRPDGPVIVGLQVPRQRKNLFQIEDSLSFLAPISCPSGDWLFARSSK